MQKTPGRTPEARAKHWTKIITAARGYPEGITAYCRFMNLSKNNYYFWFKRLRPVHPEWHDLTNHPEIISESRRPKSEGGTKEQPETEVSLTTRRRKWSISDKARILKDTDNAEPGHLGAILRQEGLYVHTLNKWRTERDLVKMAQQKKQEPASTASTAENNNLKAENLRLTKKLRQATEIIKLQKKISDLLGDLSMKDD